MKDPVAEQYEAFPYPERDPQDEKHRLIVGSPSDPVEIDHFLFRGKRDWKTPFRVLVAGGGTGDGLVQLATRLDEAGCPAEIVYLDTSSAARNIAEDRIAVRGLSNVLFHSDTLLNAAEYGLFDYIDCTGVLHHLVDPQSGMAALASALKPEGGIGLMVYAPYGRSGVYELQSAFNVLLAGKPPEERLKFARQMYRQLPPGNRFTNNRNLADHRASDAGFYDLLLHGRDRPFSVAEIVACLGGAGLKLVSFVEPGKYDLMRLLPGSGQLRDCAGLLEPDVAMDLAEKLRGTIKTHILYARPATASARCIAGAADPQAIPRLKSVTAEQLALLIRRNGELSLTLDGEKLSLSIPKSAASLLARAHGGATLEEIAQSQSMDWISFSTAWAPVHRELTAFGVLRYSRTFS